MALSLGEKLRQAREARGISISEVAEQTRISALYLEGIEADDYRALPGGIFNKGFVKSYAKYVGVDEQEALQDYASLIAGQDNPVEEDVKTYRPEVLTDDRSNSSNLLTIIFAIIILGLISWGAYTFANYYGESASGDPDPTPEANASDANTQSNSNSPDAGAGSNQQVAVPDVIKIELKALNTDTSVSYAEDGKKQNRVVSPDSPLTLEVKDTAQISYSKYHAANLQMTIGGRQITLPSEPETPSRQAIDLVITKDNIRQILQSGQISFGASDDAKTTQ